jgi:hypothetical protein
MKSPSYNLITIKGYNCILVFLAYLTSHADTFAHVSIAAIRTVSEFSPCWKIPRPEIILLVCDHNTPQVMARSEGYDPPTLGLEIRCSIQLSYERVYESGGPRSHNPQIKSLVLCQLSYGLVVNFTKKALQVRLYINV